MFTLLVIGASLYLLGCVRTFAIFAASIASAVSLGLTMVVGLGLSSLFWHDSVRAFRSGDWWVTLFVKRDGFELYQAFAVPFIFVLDMIQISIKFVIQVPNIFTIGIFGYWCYLMFMLWSVVLKILITPNGNSASA